MEPIRLDYEQVLSLLPPRPAESHKGDCGKVLLLCGSVGYTGAAALTARACVRGGAGLVFLGVPQSIYAIEAVKLDEPMVFPLPDEGGMLSPAAMEPVLKRLETVDVCAMGPGLGLGPGPEALVSAVLEQARCPIILDADGITLAARHIDKLRERTGVTIVTPHEGEFRRLMPEFALTGETRPAGAVAMARELGVIALLKGHRTLITDGNRVHENTTGNPGMATGGSGDVLTGLLAALVGQGMPPLEAAACGAWLHGAAGDLVARELGVRGLTPSDMVEVLPRLLK